MQGQRWGFAGTLVLQSEAESRLGVDDTAEKWLPGVVRGNGHDGRCMTVRQLLNHTSGLYDYFNDPALQQIGPAWLQHLHETWTPGEPLAVAVSKPPPARPAGRFVYSNTSYLLAALIVENITGSTYEDELLRRIIDLLHLRGTSSPGTREALPRPSGRAYSTARVQMPLPGVDVTEFNFSPLRVAGEVISTAGGPRPLLPRPARRPSAAREAAAEDDHPGVSRHRGARPRPLPYDHLLRDRAVGAARRRLRIRGTHGLHPRHPLPHDPVHQHRPPGPGRHGGQGHHRRRVLPASATVSGAGRRPRRPTTRPHPTHRPGRAT
ncbi:serine hydrolase domain-containing protein [Streptomyces sp. NPDC052069]|uniref:serine hydrolase domain-containing protein n=1 Tax=Streptomyces sp. NPDC052069 TaxID=3154650 RepID=UPI003446EFCD